MKRYVEAKNVHKQQHTDTYRIVSNTCITTKTLKHSCVLDNGLTDMKVIDRIMNVCVSDHIHSIHT